MKKLIMYKRYVNTGLQCVKRVLASVNVFKKKSCGASPDTAKYIKFSGFSRTMRITAGVCFPLVRAQQS